MEIWSAILFLSKYSLFSIIQFGYWFFNLEAIHVSIME